jgi:gamma-glutamylcyclotransferase (GGCT)/AIG2-like uncharacterized protein YtfP
MRDRLFVYGTLMRGFDHPMSRLLSDNADFLGPATFRGRLFLVRHYPGLLASDDAADVVHGELFRMRAPRDLLARLDDYEGCGPDSAAPAEYRREVCTVTNASGTTDAWVYLYNWDLTHAPRIASGRFCAPGSSTAANGR